MEFSLQFLGIYVIPLETHFFKEINSETWSPLGPLRGNNEAI